MTMHELLEGSTPTEILKGILILFGAGLVFTALTSWPLTLFVGLRSRPDQRAAWTAGLAYLIDSTIIIFFGGLGALGDLAPAALLPGALIVFWYWRGQFRRGWIENPEHLPEGQTLENDDWRIGLITVLCILGIFAVRVLVRLFL